MMSGSIQAFTVREATEADVSAIARVHVDAFKETHGRFNAPKLPLRLMQWTAIFAKPDDTWFCYVVENSNGEIVGFVKCNFPKIDEDPSNGHLHKIYVLRKFHGLGLGKRLLGAVTQRFLDRGVMSMHLFGEARNRSNGFYERMGAEKLLSETGKFHGGYQWRDLAVLATRCTAT